VYLSRVANALDQLITMSELWYAADRGGKPKVDENSTDAVRRLLAQILLAFEPDTRFVDGVLSGGRGGISFRNQRILLNLRIHETLIQFLKDMADSV
jgi:hypothetical protein